MILLMLVIVSGFALEVNDNILSEDVLLSDDSKLHNGVNDVESAGHYDYLMFGLVVLAYFIVLDFTTPPADIPG